MGYNTYTPDTIIKLDQIPYKIPKQLFDTFLLAFKLGNYHTPSLHSSNTEPIKTLSHTTASLQELNKEFYQFAGKWKPHMTERATLDVDTMRQTIVDNAQCIEELKGKEERLEQQNKNLQAELKQLKEEKAILEKEKTRLLPLEKYKDAVLEFMDEHYTRNEHNERWLAHVEHDDDDKPIDTDIIKYFGDWHANKVFMDEWEYDNVMESKEELNEYRIYKKVKGEIVSSGMDNSGVARNVRSIKKTINQPKN
jgi:predicted nuclease with TOPRIM domain